VHFANPIVQFAMRMRKAYVSAFFATPRLPVTSALNENPVRLLRDSSPQRGSSWSCSREMIGRMSSVIAACRRLMRALASLLTWTLVGTAVGFLGAIVFGFLGGLVLGAIHGELKLVLAVMLYTARAGAAAGAITGAAARLFNGDFWPPADRCGKGAITEPDAASNNSKQIKPMAVGIRSPQRAGGERQ